MEEIRRIASFDVDHDFITEGIYVSRIDGDITTYDLRTRIPNADCYMDHITMHSMEHMFATYVRNSDIGKSVIYFGPMGCRTGFYIILAGELCPTDIYSLVSDMCDFILGYEGTIPGASARDCGNYLDLNLDMAKYYVKKYKNEVIDDFTKDRQVYPE